MVKLVLRLCTFLFTQERECVQPHWSLLAQMPPIDLFNLNALWADFCRKQTNANKHTNVKTLCKWKHTLSWAFFSAYNNPHKHLHVNGHECCILHLILKHYTLYKTAQLSTHYHTYMKQEGWQILKGAIRRVKGQRAGKQHLGMLRHNQLYYRIFDCVISLVCV